MGYVWPLSVEALLFHVVFLASLQDLYCNPHCVGEKAEAHEGQATQGHTHAQFMAEPGLCSLSAHLQGSVLVPLCRCLLSVLK